jgi:hypothetical protein
MLEPTAEKKDLLYSKRKKLDLGSSDILLLPSLPLSEIDKLVQEFNDTLEDEKIKMAIRSITDENVLDSVGSLLKTTNAVLYQRFDMQKGVFFASKAAELYFPLGISEHTKVIW